LLAHGLWFSPGTPASSITKTGRHDIAEILLKVALKHQKSNQSSNANPHKRGVVFNATFNIISVIFWQRKNPTTNQG
jgi:hypothetical protein